MAILEGRTPDNVHNPGTPLHWLSALLLWVGGTDPLHVDRFRTLGYALVLALDFAAMGLLVRTLLRGLPLSLQVTALWSFFLCPAALRFSLIWSPEILFFAAGAVVLAACDRVLRGEPRLAGVALAGAAIGLACGVKLTWLSWVVGLFALLVFGPRVPRAGRIAAVAAALGGLALGFVAATWVILPRYPEMLDWVERLTTHGGRYGVGPQEWPEPASAFAQVAGQAMENPGWTAWWVAWLVVALVGIWLRRHRRQGWPPAIVGWVLLSVTVLAASHLIAIRDPSPRYLLPGAMGVVALVAAAGHAAPFWRRRAARILAAGAAGSLLALGLQADWREHRSVIKDCTSSRARIEARVRQHLVMQPNATVIYSWQAPIPSLALRLNGSGGDRAAVSARGTLQALDEAASSANRRGGLGSARDPRGLLAEFSRAGAWPARGSGRRLLHRQANPVTGSDSPGGNQQGRATRASDRVHRFSSTKLKYSGADLDSSPESRRTFRVSYRWRNRLPRKIR
jgi:hypothetical protein